MSGAPRGKERASHQREPRERIKVIGVGGGGNNAIDHIIRCGVRGVDFVAVNTDARCLEKSLAFEKLMIGEKLTRGLGAGSDPNVGEDAAVESRETIRACIKDCDMVYLAAGMGGGTGTGALPVIAELAKELGVLTVSVVTKPFEFEGTRKMRTAIAGIERVKNSVDALIVLPNERLIDQSDRAMRLLDAFAMCDNVLCQAVRGVTDLITMPGRVNIDFADLRTVMQHSGGAVMGVGSSSGENRAAEALRRAIESPLMESSIEGAKGVLLNICGSSSLGVLEVAEIAKSLEDLRSPDAIFKFGQVEDDSMGEEIRVIVIATGFDMDSSARQAAPAAQRAQGIKTDVRRPRDAAKPSDSAKQQEIIKPTEPMFDMSSPYDEPTYRRKKREG
ncbi:hypothetical protein FACS1894167_13910 [Synergistales bacterium]|nr:hypothetical protein FACS1894167_13910 [Synergistales bacterium]